MTATENTNGTTPLARPEPDPGATLPPEVWAILDAGRAELDAKRVAELIEQDRRAREAREAVERHFAPVKEFVRALLPAPLHEYIDWRTESLRPIYAEDLHNHKVALRVPGCWEVTLELSRHTDQLNKGWTPWELYRGYWVWEWDKEHGPVKRREATASLAESLAVSRECWLMYQVRAKRTGGE